MLPPKGIMNYHNQSNHERNYARTSVRCKLNYQMHSRKQNVFTEVWHS